MNRETFKQQLSELFPGEKFTVKWVGDTLAQINVKKELTRLELGNLFSLGVSNIKRSGEGLTVLFELTKASLNFHTNEFLFQPHTKN